MNKTPKFIDGNGEHDTCYHLCEMSDRVRFQVNAGDVLYLSSRREIRKIATWLGRYLKATGRKKVTPKRISKNG